MWMYWLVGRELVASYSGVGVHKERKWCELQFRVWWGRGWSWMSCCLQPLPCRRGAGIGKKLWAGQRPICNGGFWDPGPEDKHSTGLGWKSISLCLHCIQGFKKEGTAPRDPKWPRVASWAAVNSEGPGRRAWEQRLFFHTESSPSIPSRSLPGDARAQAMGQYNWMLMLMWPNKYSHPGNAWGNSV